MGNRAASVTLAELKRAQRAGMALEVMPDGRKRFYPWPTDGASVPVNDGLLRKIDRVRM